jgi:hypothetical protein
MRTKVLILTLGLAIGLALGDAFFSNSKGPLGHSIGPFRRLRTDLDPYAPKAFSEGNEEIIIRHFFRDRRDGFFLDVGAYHYRTKTPIISKTWGGEGLRLMLTPNSSRATWTIGRTPGFLPFSFPTGPTKKPTSILSETRVT